MTDAINKAHSAANKTIAKLLAGAHAAPKNAPGITKRTSAYFVDPRTVARKEGFNPRFDFGEIEELAASIKTNGVLNAIRIKRVPAHVIDDGKGKAGAQEKMFELIDGDRRLTAIELLLSKGHQFPEGIPAVIVDKDQDDITSLVQMFEANSGKAFLPMEEAIAYKKMQDAGLSITKICEAVSRKHVHVVATLALLQADSDVQDAVKGGTVSGTTGKKIATAARGDKIKQKELIAQAKAVGKDKAKKAALDKSLNDTRRAKAASKGKTIKMRALSDVELSAIGSSLAESLAAKLRDCGYPLDTDVRAWVAKDDKLALAFTFGALEALKAAAGMIVNLDV